MSRICRCTWKHTDVGKWNSRWQEKVLDSLCEGDDESVSYKSYCIEWTLLYSSKGLVSNKRSLSVKYLINSGEKKCFLLYWHSKILTQTQCHSQPWWAVCEAGETDMSFTVPRQNTDPTLWSMKVGILGGPMREICSKTGVLVNIAEVLAAISHFSRRYTNTHFFCLK